MPNIAKQQQQEHEQRLRENTIHVQDVKAKLELYLEGECPDFFIWLVEHDDCFDEEATNLVSAIKLLVWDIEDQKDFHLRELLDGKHCSFYTPVYEG